MTLQEKLARLSKERRDRIHAYADELLQEELKFQRRLVTTSESRLAMCEDSLRANALTYSLFTRYDDGCSVRLKFDTEEKANHARQILGP